MSKRVVFVCVSIWSFLSIACFCAGGDDTKPKPKADDTVQAERQEVIDGLKAKGIIDRVEKGIVCQLYVGDGWKALKRDEQEDFASMIFGWNYELPRSYKKADTEAGDHVRIIDVKTGKKIGQWDPVSGLSNATD